MRKTLGSKTPTENVFKTIVREVVKEEIVDLATKRELAELRSELKTDFIFFKRDILLGVEEMFRKYRDELSTKLDSFIKEIREHRDEDAGHKITHNDINEDLLKFKQIHPNYQHQIAI